MVVSQSSVHADQLQADERTDTDNGKKRTRVRYSRRHAVTQAMWWRCGARASAGVYKEGHRRFDRRSAGAENVIAAHFSQAFGGVWRSCGETRAPSSSG